MEVDRLCFWWLSACYDSIFVCGNKCARSLHFLCEKTGKPSRGFSFLFSCGFTSFTAQSSGLRLHNKNHRQMESLIHMKYCHKNIKHYVILRMNEAVATRGREKKPRKIVIFHSTKSNKQRLGGLTFGFAGKVLDIFSYPTVKQEDLWESLCFLPVKKSKPRSDLSRELLAKNFNNLFCDYGNEMRGLSCTWKRFIWIDLKNSGGGFETCQSQNHSSSLRFLATQF